MGCGNSKVSEAQSKAPESTHIKDEKNAEERPEAPADVQIKAEAEERPAVYTITLEKTEENPNLGMTLVHPVDRQHLVMKCFKSAGAAVLWNAQHENEPELQIRERDLLIEVNGVRGNSEDMMKELKASTVCSITLKRNLEPEQVTEPETVSGTGATVQAPATQDPASVNNASTQPKPQQLEDNVPVENSSGEVDPAPGKCQVCCS